jgi:hypothetical protein
MRELHARMTRATTGAAEYRWSDIDMMRVRTDGGSGGARRKRRGCPEQHDHRASEWREVDSPRVLVHAARLVTLPRLTRSSNQTGEM